MSSDSRNLRILIASSNPAFTAQCAELLRLEFNCKIYECYTSLHFTQQLELTAGYNILLFLNAPEIHQVLKAKFVNYKCDHILIYNQLSDLQSEFPHLLKTLCHKSSNTNMVSIHYKLLLHYGSLPMDVYTQNTIKSQMPYLKANTMVKKEDLLNMGLLGSEFFYVHTKDVEKFSDFAERSIEAHLLELSLQSNETYEIFKNFKSIVRTQFPSLSKKTSDEFDAHFINALKLCCKDSAIKKSIEKKLYANLYYPLHMYFVGLLSCRLADLANLKIGVNHTLLASCGLLHDLALSEDKIEEFELILGLESGNYDQYFTISENLLHHGEEAVGLIIDIENLPDWVPEILLKHHERPMGQGFPVGEEIRLYDGELAVFILAHMLFDNIYVANNSGKSLENIFKCFLLDRLQNGPLRDIAIKIEKMDIFTK